MNQASWVSPNAESKLAAVDEIREQANSQQQYNIRQLRSNNQQNPGSIV